MGNHIDRAAAAIAAVALLTGCGGGETAKPRRSALLAKLPQATTYTTLPGIPLDPDPFGRSDVTLVHPLIPVPVSAQAGGPAVAVLPSTQLGGPTWVPVVETTPGWHRVLLPSRPNRATGWIPADGKALQSARSTQLVEVDLSERRLTLRSGGRATGTWRVAVGAAKTPTPVGRTFLLASLRPATATYSPLILPVGTHSDTLDTFGGGPGTVALHGWPNASVFGRAVTHGCVRVPAEALKRLALVPLGTPVVISA